jgi:hypothetical protein
MELSLVKHRTAQDHSKHHSKTIFSKKEQKILKKAPNMMMTLNRNLNQLIRNTNHYSKKEEQVVKCHYLKWVVIQDILSQA